MKQFMCFFIGVRFNGVSYAISLLTLQHTHTGAHMHALRQARATVRLSTLALSASQIKATRLICCYVTIPT